MGMYHWILLRSSFFIFFFKLNTVTHETKIKTPSPEKPRQDRFKAFHRKAALFFLLKMTESSFHLIWNEKKTPFPFWKSEYLAKNLQISSNVMTLTRATALRCVGVNLFEWIKSFILQVRVATLALTFFSPDIFSCDNMTDKWSNYTLIPTDNF